MAMNIMDKAYRVCQLALGEGKVSGVQLMLFVEVVSLLRVQLFDHVDGENSLWLAKL